MKHEIAPGLNIWTGRIATPASYLRVIRPAVARWLEPAVGPNYDGTLDDLGQPALTRLAVGIDSTLRSNAQLHELPELADIKIKIQEVAQAAWTALSGREDQTLVISEMFMNISQPNAGPVPRHDHDDVSLVVITYLQAHVGHGLLHLHIDEATCWDLDVESGMCVCIPGNLPHSAEPNTAPYDRCVVTTNFRVA